MKRVIVHWTGGTYEPSDYERTRYHSFTHGDGTFSEGDKPPEVNKHPLGPDYVRHTGGGNTDAIGHALCGMGGDDVTEKPLNMGQWPVRGDQLRAAAVDIAERYCSVYGIPPEEVITHAEFYARTGRGKYKWDITCLNGYRETTPPDEIGNRLRAMIRMTLEGQGRPVPTKGLGALIAAFFEAIARLFK